MAIEKCVTRCISDANEAVADVAYRLSEIMSIYPITPSTPMAEHCDKWSSSGRKNIFGTVPTIAEMQSEGGAAGAVHGALQLGALTTTFTASQGLLLMIPNMYEIAGEMMPFVMHVASRSVTTHALSIFGDHSDVMACRQIGFAMLSSCSVQEGHDMACISHISTLECRVPFIHFFDGFRTSHEINVYDRISDEVLSSIVDMKFIDEHRSRSLSPDNPFIRGTSQNPDVYFQGRERANSFYNKTPDIVEKYMNLFGALTGRNYGLFEFVGPNDAEHVIISMGSSCSTIEEVIKFLNKNGEKVGLIKVHLYRPFSIKHFSKVLPKSVKSIAVLDRTKEAGSVGEPLFEDIVSALNEIGRNDITVIGGRYGLGSKEFSPAMVKSIFDELKAKSPKKHFTVGITDDVTHMSLQVSKEFKIDNDDRFEAVFFGLGSDGTVGANKNTIKIIGGDTENYAQAYFVYDSKKSGAMTVSHLRFGPKKIEAPYLIDKADFVACHQYSFLNKYDVLKYAKPGATFLINAPYSSDNLWNHLPRVVQESIKYLGLKVYAIDAYDVAKKAGMGGKINVVMQTCFFAISKILPRDEAISKIKKSIEKTYGAKGESVVQKNFSAVDATLEHLYELDVDGPINGHEIPPTVSENAPDFVKNITAKIISGSGDDLPVSAFPIDGTWPSATSQWEKRRIAQEIPVWNPEFCIECNKCVSVCPHAALRSKFYDEKLLADAPDTFRSKDFRSNEHKNCKFTVQCSPEDCTGCGLCNVVCPAKDKKDDTKKAINMVPVVDVSEVEKENYNFFSKLPVPDPKSIGTDMKSTQFKQPLFEFSGACAGCGEAQYARLLTQIFGDRLIIANATGCSSIYGGNLPTTPYCVNKDGRGPAWANSLLEDNAEFGFGMILAEQQKKHTCISLLKQMEQQIGPGLVSDLLNADQTSEEAIEQQRERVHKLRDIISGIDSPESEAILRLSDSLVNRSIWMVGGDGWAYDIGYGGLDHVLASGKNVNILVLDTEVYSNTGGQQSKATPTGAVASFASNGKSMPKKNLGLLAITYRNAYVAQISIGAKDSHACQALRDAESYDGPSLVIAYCACIAHGYDLRNSIDQQKKAVDSGYWPLFRYDPRKRTDSTSGFSLDSKEPKLPLIEYMSAENRFRTLMNKNPEQANLLLKKSEDNIRSQYAFYKMLSENVGW